MFHHETTFFHQISLIYASKLTFSRRNRHLQKAKPKLYIIYNEFFLNQEQGTLRTTPGIQKQHSIRRIHNLNIPCSWLHNISSNILKFHVKSLNQFPQSLIFTHFISDHKFFIDFSSNILNLSQLGAGAACGELMCVCVYNEPEFDRKLRFW